MHAQRCVVRTLYYDGNDGVDNGDKDGREEGQGLREEELLVPRHAQGLRRPQHTGPAVGICLQEHGLRYTSSSTDSLTSCALLCHTLTPPSTTVPVYSSSGTPC